MGILSSLDASQQIITPREALFKNHPSVSDVNRKMTSGSSHGSTYMTTEAASEHWQRNETLLTALWNGCFDRTYLDFCASRLTDFACIFWTDERVLDTVYKDKDSRAFETILSKMTLEGIEIDSKRYSGEGFGASPFKLSDLVPSQVDTARSVCKKVRGKEGLIDTDYQFTQSIVLPILLTFALVGNILITRILYRLGRQQLPVCLYAAIIAGLDLLVLFLRAGDLWIQAMTNKSPTILFLLIHQSMCQVTTFTYSCLTHFHSFVYIAMAIDNWRLVRTPKYFFPIHTRAWVRHACLLMLALVLTLNAQFLWTFAIVRQNSTSNKERGFVCLFAEKFSEEEFRDYVWPIIDFVVADYLPGGIVAFLTSWSLCILLRANNNTEEMLVKRKGRPRLNSLIEKLGNSQSLMAKAGDSSFQRQMNHCCPSDQTLRMSTSPEFSLREYVVDVPLFCGVRRAVVAVCIAYLVLHMPQNVYYAFKYHQFRVEVERERTTDPIRMFTSETHRQERRLERLTTQNLWRPFYESFEFAAQFCVFFDYSLKFLIYIILVVPIRKRFIASITTPVKLCRRFYRASRKSFRGSSRLDEEVTERSDHGNFSNEVLLTSNPRNN